MQITIECLTGSLAGKAFYFDQAEVTLGRGENVRKDVDFADTDLGVSRNHGSLIVRGNRVYLNDQSRAGTTVGGQRIQGTTHELQPEDELQLGGSSGPKVRVRFQAVAPPIAAVPPTAQPVVPATAQAPIPQPPQPVIPAIAQSLPPQPPIQPVVPPPAVAPVPPAQPVAQNTMLQVPTPAPEPMPPMAPKTILQVPASSTPQFRPEALSQAEETVIQPLPPAQVKPPNNTLEPLRPSNEAKAPPLRPIAPAGEATVFQAPPTPIANDVTRLQVPPQEAFQPPRAMPAPPPMQPPVSAPPPMQPPVSAPPPIQPPMSLDATLFQANAGTGYQAPPPMPPDATQYQRPPMPPDATQYQRPPMGETMIQPPQANNQTIFQSENFDTGQTILQESGFSWVPAIIAGLLATVLISFLVWFFVFHR
jgi:FHA domain